MALILGTDPRSVGAIRDPALMRALHLTWMECAICEYSDIKLSLHHVLKNPRQDVKEGLVMLCGDGVRGCHGLIEANDVTALLALAQHIIDCRPDVVAHLAQRLGGPCAAGEWLDRRLQGVRKVG